MKVENCRNCGAEIAVQEGRRKREFCDNKGKCKYEWHKKNKTKVKTFNGHKIEAGKAYILKDGKPIELTTPEGIDRLMEVGLIPQNAIIKKKEEKLTQPTPDEPSPITELIKKYEDEIETLGGSPLANKRRKFLWNRISELKQQLSNQ